MLIRRAAYRDAPDVKACVAASLNATYGGLWTAEPLVVPDDGWERAWVAEAGGLIVGAGLSVGAIVSDLWVLPQVQSQGAGSAILAALEDEIASGGFEMGRLRCLEPNMKARRFYAARGWREVRIYPHETLPLNTVDFQKPLVGRLP